MSYLISQFKYNYSEFKSMKTQSKIAIVIMAGIFLPFFLGGVGVLLIALYCIINSGVRKQIFMIKHAWFLIGFCFLSLAVSVFYKNTVGIIGAIGMTLIFIYSLWMRYIMDDDLYNYIMKIVCFLSIGSSICAMIQLILIIPTFAEYRSVSTFFNANYYATITEFVILICFYKLSSCKEGRWFYLISLSFNLLGLFATGCRSAWIGLAGALFFMLILQKRYRLIFLIVALLVGFFILMFVDPEAIPRWDSFEGTATKRFNIWKATLVFLPDSFIMGKGLWAYNMLIHGTKYVEAYHTHNIVLESLLDFGLVGTSVVMVYIVSSFRAVFQKVKQGCKDKKWILMFGVLVSILGHGITDVTFVGVETSIFMLFLFSGVGIYEKYSISNKELNGQ
ncbi:MAG: O-antigen ligase family protein [Oscillospiraceae bacterium]|nr:O-antigen ligase family protein [Oscillospiraceae bacterium]